MLKFSDIHFQYMKTFVPFSDVYVLINAKEKTKEHAYDCVVDRQYTKLQYMTFAMIMRDSTAGTLEANLLKPSKWIKEALSAQEVRKIEQKTTEQVEKSFSPSGERPRTGLFAKDIFKTEVAIYEKLGCNLIKESLTHDAVKDYKSQIAIQHQTEEQIEEALREAHEILFKADLDEMPLYSSSGWQFLVDLRQRFSNLINLQKSVRRSNTIAKKKAKAKEASDGGPLLGEDTNRGATPTEQAPGL